MTATYSQSLNGAAEIIRMAVAHLCERVLSKHEPGAVVPMPLDAMSSTATEAMKALREAAALPTVHTVHKAERALAMAMLAAASARCAGVERVLANDMSAALCDADVLAEPVLVAFDGEQ